ncbi:MAG: hypothetical protein DMG76_29170 [Acidobacteria bacterium]|nr:MAG: hypothetical protein DMG76_29170 [Acidobacteriota bacterium]
MQVIQPQEAQYQWVLPQAGFRCTISAMADQRQPSVRDEEELRLLAIAEACHSEEIAASDLLTNPHQSLLYAEYQRLIEELRAKRVKGHQSRIALKAHRYKMGLERHNFK